MCIHTDIQDSNLQIIMHCAELRAMTADGACSLNESQQPCWHVPTRGRTRPQKSPLPGYRRQYRLKRVLRSPSRKHTPSSSGLVRCLETTCNKNFSSLAFATAGFLLKVIYGVFAFVSRQINQKRLVLVVQRRLVHENRRFLWAQREDDKSGPLPNFQSLNADKDSSATVALSG